MGILFPAAVTQFSMVVDDLAEIFEVNKSIILTTDTVRAVCLVAAMFFGGIISNRLGLKKTMALGISFQVIPQLLMPLAISIKSLPMLFLLKGLQGLNAMAFPLYISSIVMWMSSKYIALATAIFNGSFAAGSGIGAFIAGKIIPAFGVSASFTVIGAACGILAVPALILTHEKAEDRRIRREPVKRKGSYIPIMRMPATWFLILALTANTWVTQSVTVDMSVFTAGMGFGYSERGSLMLWVSIITVGSSIAAGAVSDYFAAKSDKPLNARIAVMSIGYVLSFAASMFIVRSAGSGFVPLALTTCTMIFGASWAGGVFWSLPRLVYGSDDQVMGTAFCSGASNIPNPIAPLVVGVVLGGRGLWQLGWGTCAVISLLSLASLFALTKRREPGVKGRNLETNI